MHSLFTFFSSNIKKLRALKKDLYKKEATEIQQLPYFSRDEATRTPDPYVPNVVRYQLRYIPKAF